MKTKIFKNLTRKTSNALALAVAGLLVPAMSFAQNSNLGQEVLTKSKQAMKDLTNDLVGLLQVICGIGALVTLVMVIFKIFKGDREAAEKIAWWVGGLTIGFVLLTVVSRLINTM